MLHLPLQRGLQGEDEATSDWALQVGAPAFQLWEAEEMCSLSRWVRGVHHDCALGVSFGLFGPPEGARDDGERGFREMSPVEVTLIFLQRISILLFFKNKSGLFTY